MTPEQVWGSTLSKAALDQLFCEARTFAAFDTELASGTSLPKPQGVFPRYVEPKAAA